MSAAQLPSLKLNASDRKMLEQALTRLAAAIKMIDSTDSRLDALRAKQDSVASELEKPVDPLNDSAVEKRSARERQHSLLETEIAATETALIKSEKDLFDAADFFGRTLDGVLHEFQQKVGDSVSKALAPFFLLNPSKAVAMAVETDLVQAIRTRRGFLTLRPSQRGTCELLLRWGTSTLACDVSWMLPETK